MLMLVMYDDGSEDSFDVSPTTRHRRVLRDGYWTFRTTDGGEVSLSDEIVERVYTGNAVPQQESA